MIADDMSFFDHSAHKFGLSFEIVSDKEKSGGNLFFFQDVENLSGASVFISRVKSQINDFFAFVVAIKRPVLVKFFL